MRILLISPGKDEDYAKRMGLAFKLPPLGITTVAGLTKPGIDIRLLDEQVEAIDFNDGADIVGISMMTAAAPRVYRLAEEFRRRGAKVVLGGPHASAVPEEAAQHCDAVVVGEAEGSWPRLIEDFEKGKLEKIYANAEKPSLAGLPEPRRDLYKKKAYLIKNTFQTTRGCPYACSFCSVSGVFGEQYRLKPVEDVVRSIEITKARFAGFIDDNICGNKKYSKELFKALIPLHVGWIGQASVNAAEDLELLQLAKKSGCVGLFMGFETLSQGSMGEIGKSQNKIAAFKDNIKRLHDHGIIVLGAFVFGFDSDDVDVFKRTVDFIYDAKLDLAQFTNLTPLPGTQLHKKLAAENRIIDTDWRHYDTESVVFKPAQMTPDQLWNGTGWAWNNFYSRGNILRRMMGMKFDIIRLGMYVVPLLIMNFGFKKVLDFDNVVKNTFFKDPGIRNKD